MQRPLLVPQAQVPQLFTKWGLEKETAEEKLHVVEQRHVVFAGQLLTGTTSHSLWGPRWMP